tara:strand:+ start:5182 stop:5991 length:810 start_codon:yes stop_codon:yes gene_type:complete
MLNSLLKQEFNDFEIIISDNGSIDQTEQVCINFKNQFKKFNYFKQKKTIHVLDNYKYLFDKCRTKYFMWLPDDDIIEENYIKNCFNYIINNKDYVLVSGQCKYYINNKFSFEGNKINIEDENVNKRVYRHYSEARDNGNFYGIYDKEKILDFIYPKEYGGDLIFLGNIILFGKFKCLNSTTIHRDLGSGTSGSLENVVKVLKLSKLQLYFFHYVCAYDIFINSTLVKKRYKNKIKLSYFFNIICSFYYLKKNFIESMTHLIKSLIIKKK